MNQKRTQNSEQPKSKPSFLSTEQQTSRVQKILENAKKYEGKKDYMMEGIKNIKKKPQSNSQQKRTDIYYQQQQYKNRRTSR